MPVSFLDLSAELRNQVYHEALSHDREHGRIATVTLLRTCRQIYKEARGILQAQSTFLISVSTIDCRLRAGEVVSRASTVQLSGDCLPPPSNPTTVMNRIVSTFSSAMLDLSTIRVRIHLPPGIDEDGSEPIRRFTAALTRHLISDDRKRHVEVTLVNKEMYDGNQIVAIVDFSSLMYLGPQVDLKLNGLEDCVATYVQRLRKGILETSTGQVADIDWDFARTHYKNDSRMLGEVVE